MWKLMWSTPIASQSIPVLVLFWVKSCSSLWRSLKVYLRCVLVLLQRYSWLIITQERIKEKAQRGCTFCCCYVWAVANNVVSQPIPPCSSSAQISWSLVVFSVLSKIGRLTVATAHQDVATLRTVFGLKKLLLRSWTYWLRTLQVKPDECSFLSRSLNENSIVPFGGDIITTY